VTCFDDLFRGARTEAVELDFSGRRKIDWAELDLSPEITVSYQGTLIRPQAVDLSRVRELGPAR